MKWFLSVLIAVSSCVTVFADEKQIQSSRISREGDDEAERNKPDGIDGIHTVTIDDNCPKDLFEIATLGSVKYGATITATILIQNATKQSISYLSVMPSCTCTSVEIPQTPTKPLDSSVIRVSFPAEGRSTASIAQQVKVKCSGPLENLTIMVKAKPAEMVAFAVSEYTFVIPNDSSETSGKTKIALIATDDTSPSDVKFNIAPNSAIVAINPISDGGKPAAEVEIDFRKATDENCVGALELSYDRSRYTDRATYRIIKESKIDLHPEVISMRPSGTVAKSKLQGHGLLKLNIIKKGKDAIEMTGASFSGQIKSRKIEIEFLKIKGNIAQVKFTANSEDPNVIGGEEPGFLTVRLSDGSEVSVPFLFSFL